MPTSPTARSLGWVRSPQPIEVSFGTNQAEARAVAFHPAEEEDGLVRWALDRLRSIPREPEDAFCPEVGGLLVEFRSRRSPWNAAALRLLDDTYTFVATGPGSRERAGVRLRCYVDLRQSPSP